MRDSTQIENLAVSRIIEVFSSCKRICPYINSHDKEPLWDGALYLYDSDDHNTKTTQGRIACQVKGKDDLSIPETESYYLSREDLANYLRDGGVLFFLVHTAHPIKPSYWAKLTPVELRNHLKELDKKNRQGRSIVLSRIPDNLATCEAEVFEFYQHCQLQKAPPIEMEKIAHPGSRFHIVGTGKKGVPPIVALTKGFHYLYGCEKNDKVFNVVGNSQYAIEMSKQVDDHILIGDSFFNVPVSIVIAHGSSYLKIGNFIQIDIIKDDGGEPRLNYSVEKINGVRERSLALQVLLAMDEAREVSVPKLQASISCSEVLLPNNVKSDIKGELINSLRVVRLLDQLHITSDLNLDALSSKDLTDLNTLYQAIIENKPVKPNDAVNDIVLSNFIVGELNILVWLIKEEGCFFLKDFFSSAEYEIAVHHNKTNKKFLVNRFALLNAEDYIKYSNIDWQLIPTDYIKLNLHINEVAQQANMDALNLLTAYDKSNRKEILDAAHRLTTWLMEYGKGTQDALTYRINNLQTIKRMRDLSEPELQEIIGYAEDPSSSVELKYCCDLLLGDQRRASLHFSNMPTEQQSFYDNLPITRFRKKD